jgi:hypothetical protein
MFGRTRSIPPVGARLRPIRGRVQPSRDGYGLHAAVPREEWITIPVPAIIDPDIFETVQEQLDENRKRKRDRRRRPGWLLQGLVVCRQCGYAFYGKMARSVVGGRKPADYGYYRCTGTDAHTFGGQARPRHYERPRRRAHHVDAGPKDDRASTGPTRRPLRELAYGSGSRRAARGPPDHLQLRPVQRPRSPRCGPARYEIVTVKVR